MTETIEVTVAELDCADEAQQIQAALGRLDGVVEIRTAVSTRKTVIAYDPGRVEPETIRRAIQELGMTATDTRARR